MRYLPHYIALLVLLFSSLNVYAQEQEQSYQLRDEAPTALNIVPWKQRESAIKEQPLRSSPVLEQVLEPIDRETLKREIEFHQNNKQQ